jgi:hypothetical protein
MIRYKYSTVQYNIAVFVVERTKIWEGDRLQECRVRYLLWHRVCVQWVTGTSESSLCENRYPWRHGPAPLMMAPKAC